MKLLELLRLDTDEQHPMTTSQICTRLDTMGIICDRRTLSKDIALLNEQGYEVMDTSVGHVLCGGSQLQHHGEKDNGVG